MTYPSQLQNSYAGSHYQMGEQLMRNRAALQYDAGIQRNYHFARNLTNQNGYEDDNKKPFYESHYNAMYNRQTQQPNDNQILTDRENSSIKVKEEIENDYEASMSTGSDPSTDDINNINCKDETEAENENPKKKMRYENCSQSDDNSSLRYENISNQSSGYQGGLETLDNFYQSSAYQEQYNARRSEQITCPVTDTQANAVY